MQIVKDFYLLGRGELYQVFIDHAQHMLKTPPTAVTEHGALIFKFERANLSTKLPILWYYYNLFTSLAEISLAVHVLSLSYCVLLLLRCKCGLSAGCT